jgi:hypothetical protein
VVDAGGGSQFFNFLVRYGMGGEFWMGWGSVRLGGGGLYIGRDESWGS